MGVLGIVAGLGLGAADEDALEVVVVCGSFTPADVGGARGAGGNG